MADRPKKGNDCELNVDLQREIAEFYFKDEFHKQLSDGFDNLAQGIEECVESINNRGGRSSFLGKYTHTAEIFAELKATYLTIPTEYRRAGDTNTSHLNQVGKVINSLKRYFRGLDTQKKRSGKQLDLIVAFMDKTQYLKDAVESGLTHAKHQYDRSRLYRGKST